MFYSKFQDTRSFRCARRALWNYLPLVIRGADNMNFIINHYVKNTVLAKNMFSSIKIF